MSYMQDEYFRDIVKELRLIRKSLDNISKEVGKPSFTEEDKKFEQYINHNTQLDMFSNEKKQTYIVAVDFDGTLCENKYPDIGDPIQPVIDYVKRYKDSGAKVILWTNRVGTKLYEALKWCSDHDLKFDAVNENLPCVINQFGSDTRKIFANEYIDDRCISVDQLLGAKLITENDIQKIGSAGLLFDGDYAQGWNDALKEILTRYFIDKDG